MANSDTLTTVPRLMKDLCYIPTPQTHTHHPYDEPNNRPEMATFHVWHDGWWDKRECYVWYTFGRGRELGGRRIMDPFYPLFPPVTHTAWTVDDGAIKSCRDKQKRMKDKNRAHPPARTPGLAPSSVRLNFSLTPLSLKAAVTTDDDPINDSQQSCFFYTFGCHGAAVLICHCVIKEENLTLPGEWLRLCSCKKSHRRHHHFIMMPFVAVGLCINHRISRDQL